MADCLILAAIVPLMILCLYALIRQMVMGIPVGNTPAPNGIMITVFLGLFILLWGLFSLKLEVWIDQQGIHYRFFPLIWKSKLISKEEILRFEIRKYKPLWEYGGWGIRTGLWNKWGRAYCMEGNTGLQLYLKNGKKILFGTKSAPSIQYAMSKLMNPR